MENKTVETKNYYQTNKKISRKIARVYRNLSEDEKLKKTNHANNKNKNISDENRERKEQYMRNYYYKRKKFLNNLLKN